MHGHYWFYNPNRMLLVQKNKEKEDEKLEDIRKSYRQLGAKTNTALRSMKSSEAEIFVTPKIEDSEMLPIFENSFRLSNYENSMKREK